MLAIASIGMLHAGEWQRAPKPADTTAITKWSQHGYGMFIHFGMSTFVGDEYGSGKEASTTYAPTALDVDQWISVAHDAGMKYAMLTATVRCSVAHGEALVLPILALATTPLHSVNVHIRPLGHGEWKSHPATHVARAVFTARLPAAQKDFEITSAPVIT